MRPKFRAWSKTEKIMSDVKKIDFNNGEVDARCFEETEIEEVELMCSTGLFDKKGVEIFEGDIITNGKDVMCMKRHNTLGFYVEKKGEVEFIADCAVLEEFEEDAKDIADSLEIIGNIYENPELLEEKNET